MAWWGTSYVLGGFLATVFATFAATQVFLLPSMGWRRGFLFPAIVLCWRRALVRHSHAKYAGGGVSTRH